MGREAESSINHVLSLLSFFAFLLFFLFFQIYSNFFQFRLLRVNSFRILISVKLNFKVYHNFSQVVRSKKTNSSSGGGFLVFHCHESIILLIHLSLFTITPRLPSCRIVRSTSQRLLLFFIFLDLFFLFFLLFLFLFLFPLFFSPSSTSSFFFFFFVFFYFFFSFSSSIHYFNPFFFNPSIHLKCFFRFIFFNLPLSFFIINSCIVIFTPPFSPF